MGFEPRQTDNNDDQQPRGLLEVMGAVYLVLGQSWSNLFPAVDVMVGQYQLYRTALGNGWLIVPSEGFTGGSATLNCDNERTVEVGTGTWCYDQVSDEERSGSPFQSESVLYESPDDWSCHCTSLILIRMLWC